MPWLIYKHTLVADCPHCGWSYIGQTCCDTEKRWRRDGSGYTFGRTQTGQPVVFAKAIDKYGWENFTHEILEDGIETIEEANLREQYWIDFYHTYVNDPNCAGYNMTKGGGGSIGFKHTDETKALIKQRLREVFPDGRNGENGSMYGKHHTEQALQKMSKLSKEHSARYWRGKHRSDATKEKLRQANLGKRLTDEQKDIRAKKVVATKIKNGTYNKTWVKIAQFSADGSTFIKEWPKLTEASAATNTPPGNIVKVCQGTRKSAGGFKWAYVDKA